MILELVFGDSSSVLVFYDVSSLSVLVFYDA
jgi:hypothetical protein